MQDDRLLPSDSRQPGTMLTQDMAFRYVGSCTTEIAVAKSATEGSCETPENHIPASRVFGPINVASRHFAVHAVGSLVEHRRAFFALHAPRAAPLPKSLFVSPSTASCYVGVGSGRASQTATGTSGSDLNTVSLEAARGGFHNQECKEAAPSGVVPRWRNQVPLKEDGLPLIQGLKQTPTAFSHRVSRLIMHACSVRLPRPRFLGHHRRCMALIKAGFACTLCRPVTHRDSRGALSDATMGRHAGLGVGRHRRGGGCAGETPPRNRSIPPCRRGLSLSWPT